MAEPEPGSPTSRLSAAEIFDRVATGAEDEVGRPAHNLLFSAVAGGLTMGVSGIAVAALSDATGPSHEALVFLGYPLGFVAVILGRQQLFTENTLFPVALALRERAMLGPTARLWGLVLAGNVVGALLFSLLVVRTPALPTGVRDELVKLGQGVTARDMWTVLWTGVVAGWLIALVAWLVTACTDTSAQVLVVLLITYVVGLGHLAHSVAGSAEALSALAGGGISAADFVRWFVAAVVGNAIGGVGMVALLNYGQVHGTAEAQAHIDSTLEDRETVS
ncbi:MAG TPA: formate/nitrite transporter family protein [Candidatus Angelobacter sp.]|nr:formate/nitrite transporter family protein [Candidatus Angelobacter sp.]